MDGKRSLEILAEGGTQGECKGLILGKCLAFACGHGIGDAAQEGSMGRNLETGEWGERG